MTAFRHWWMSVVLALVMFGTIPSRTFAEPVCTPEHFVGPCSKLVGSLPYEPGPNGSLLFKPTYKANVSERQIKRYMNPSPSRRRQAIQLANQARNELRALIVGDMRPEFWTEEQKAMVARLDSVTIDFYPNDDENCAKEVPAGWPNASYRTDRHAILLCPAMANLPPAEMFRNLAHEMGHVVDACHLSYPIYEIDPDASLHPKDPKRLAACFPKESAAGVAEIRKALGSATQRLWSSSLYGVQLEKCGLARKKEEAFKGKPTLFGEIQGCMKDRYADAFEGWVSSQKAQFAEGIGAAKEHGLDIDVKSGLRPECMSTCKEHFADAVSGTLLASWAKSKSLRPEELRSGFVDAAAYACLEKNAGVGNMVENWRYPPWSTRLHIMLQEPSLQSAMGCKAETQKSACSLVGHSPYKANAAPSKPAPSKGSRITD